MFLPSVTDSEGMSNDDRLCIPTASALTAGAYGYGTNGECSWWTRSPGISARFAAHVYHDGTVYSGGNVVSYDYVAARPVINLMIDTINVTYYNGTNGLSDDGNVISGMSASSVVKGNNLTKPTNPTKDGYVFAGWYTDPELKTRFEFNADGKSTAALSADTKLYAKWDKYTASTYFLASKTLVDSLDLTEINKISDATARAQALEKAAWQAAEKYSSATFVSGATLKADVEKMKTEQQNGKTTATGETLAKYKGYMEGDAVRLYTSYGEEASNWADATNIVGTEEAAQKNKYAEFRIINVGSHMNSAIDTTGDGSVLTFHATHSLPAAEAMATENSNVDGWTSCNGKASLYTKLQKGGVIYNLFPSAFTDDVMQVSKANNTGNMGSAVSTSFDYFFLLSYSEIVGSATDYASSAPAVNTEGMQYAFFASQSGGINGSDSNSCISGINTARSGALPLSANNTYWWLRSPLTTYSTYFLGVYGNGDPYNSYYASNAFGVAPAFCM